MRHQAKEERGDFANAVKTMLRRWPRLYIALIYVISPVCTIGLTARKFVRRFPADARILNVGSGVHRYRSSMVNLDIYPYRGVDIVADATALPFPDDTFEGAICECLLEHVPEPKKVVKEMVRVLKPGGTIFLSVPFIYPFHGCPNDFYRWTLTGMKNLCDAGETVEIRSRSGPTSALVSILVTYCAIFFSFGSQTLYHILSMLFLIPFFPLKYLDLILGRFPTAMHGTEAFYAVLRKAGKGGK
jgi:SAM-dependent methyltransferase